MCRAFLSPFCVNKKDPTKYSFKEEDSEEWDFIVEGRYNLGVVSLNVVMIMAKSILDAGFNINSRTYNKYEQALIRQKFFYNLTFYLEAARKILVRTYNYISEMPASTNPMLFTQGLAWNGNLKPDDKIGKVLMASTSSFGYVGLNELQYLYNQKQIDEDGDFAYEVLKYIDEFKNKAKVQDNINYALYSTPAESLAGTQVEQFRKAFGVVKGVSDKEFFTNSFHVPVWADVTPIEKQDIEERFFKIPTGGRIQYVRIPNSNNPKAVRQLIERGMEKGYYQGVNLNKSSCLDCGHEFFEDELPDFDGTCPCCHSDNLVTINRVCGYMGYSRLGSGKTRLNDSKLQEISFRKCM